MILIVFPLKQWLQVRASFLGYSCIARLVNFCIFHYISLWSS